MRTTRRIRMLCLAALFATPAVHRTAADEPTRIGVQVQPQSTANRLVVEVRQPTHILTEADLGKLSPEARAEVEKLLKNPPQPTIVHSYPGQLVQTRPVTEAELTLKPQEPKVYRYIMGVVIDQKHERTEGIPENEPGRPAGVIVTRVVPDSPALKAGLQDQDVIVQVGETKIETVEQLLDAVEASAGKEISVTFRRGDETRTVAVLPQERPKEFLYSTALPNAGVDFPWVELEALLRTPHGDGVELRAVHPGILLARRGGALPDGLSISIQRTGKQPAKIEVRRGEQTWNVTEQELGQLPDDVRPHVEGMLHGVPNFDVLRYAAPGQPHATPLPQRVMVAPHAETAPRAIVPGRAVQRVEVQRVDPVQEQLQRIEKQLRELQQAVDALKSKADE